MLYILIVLAIFVATTIAIFKFNSDVESRIGLTALLWGAGGFMFIALPLLISYESLADMNGQKVQVEQYQQTLAFYAEKGAEGFSGVLPDRAVTDLKYQNYQSKLAEVTIDLRNLVASYNNTLEKKLTWKRSIWFSWIVFVPEDTTPLELKLTAE